MSVESLAQELAQHVRTLHSNPSRAKQATAALEQFQQSGSALQVVALILMGGTEEQTVLHFAAQTLVLKVQSNTLPVSAELEQSLYQLLLKYGVSNTITPVLRTLVTAYASYLLLNFAQFSSLIQSRLQALPSLAALSLLSCIPEEVKNSKLLSKSSTRSEIADLLIRDMLATALGLIDQAGVSFESLNALKAWVKLARYSTEARRLRSFSEKYSCSQAIQLLGNMALFRQVLGAFHSPTTPVQAAELCANVISEALSLTTDTRRDLPFIVMIAESVAALGQGLRGAFPTGTDAFITEKSRADYELIQRSKLYCRLLGELAQCHYYSLVLVMASVNDAVNSASSSSTSGEVMNVSNHPATVTAAVPGLLSSLIEGALYFVAVRNLELCGTALDFFFHLLSCFLNATEFTDEEDELFATDELAAAGAGASGMGGSGRGLAGGRSFLMSRRHFYASEHVMESARLVLLPFFQRLVPLLLLGVCFPSMLDDPAVADDGGFDAEPFQQFREVCANVLADACAVVDAGWVIEQIGATIDAVSAAGDVSQWHRLEACVFILTAVAPKAAAGEDRVIPLVLRMIPTMGYPAAGSAGLLLRAAAGRMVTYTAGYLRFEGELCMKLLSFFILELLPGLPTVVWQKQTGELDLMQHAQSVCAGAVRQMLTAARHQLANVEEFAQVFRALVSLVVDERLSFEARSQIVSGIGLVVVELREWSAIKQALNELVEATSHGAKRVLDHFQPPSVLNINATGPVAVKVYFCALACVTSLPRNRARPSADLRGDDQLLSSSDEDNDTAMTAGQAAAHEHPILAVMTRYEQLSTALLTRVCLYFSDLTSLACTSIVSVFSHNRDAAAQSPLLLTTLQCLLLCFQTVPSSHYMHFVRLTITHFGELTRVHLPLVQLLSELAGAFTKHATMLLARNTALTSLTFDEARMVQETFAVLSEVLRYVDLISYVTREGGYLPGVLQAAAQCLTDCVVDAQTVGAVGGLLHFTERVFTWIDPPIIMHAQEDTERVSREVSAFMRALLAGAVGGAPVTGAVDMLLLRLVEALCVVWGEKTAEHLQLLGSVGISIRLGLASSLGQTVAAKLKEISDRQWTPLVGQDKVNHTLAQLEGNCRNGRVFGKIVGEFGRDLVVERRRAKYKQ